MFRRISYRIALQFTGFVFALLLVNGLIFLAADFGNARRQLGDRLERMAQLVLERTVVAPEGITVALPPPMRERVRIVDFEGNPVYTGGFFEDVPFSEQVGIRRVMVEGEHYDILTSLIDRRGTIVGYVQVAEVERLQLADLPPRALLYLLVSGVISVLTFLAGLLFARSSLKPAERMVERLEQFTQDASHELRTPIAALSSSLDLALKSKRYKEGIVSAKEDVKQVAILVERLLELTRLDQLTLAREPVDLSSLVESTIEKHRSLAAERRVTLVCETVAGITVQGDAALLRQVASNVIANAIKFSKPEGGTVTVRLTRDALSVSDTGIGIARESLKHIFNRFYQANTSRSQGGLGLGLALVKRIVELHGWTIGVASEEGKGTTFTVRF